MTTVTAITLIVAATAFALVVGVLVRDLRGDGQRLRGGSAMPPPGSPSWAGGQAPSRPYSQLEVHAWPLHGPVRDREDARR